MDTIIQLISFAVSIVCLASMWVVFTKADKPGWAVIIPIYNIIVMMEIADKPLWWIVLFFVPVANFIVMIMISIGLAERFGKSAGFGLGLAFLSFIFYPMLAFGDAEYAG